MKSQDLVYAPENVVKYYKASNNKHVFFFLKYSLIPCVRALAILRHGSHRPTLTTSTIPMPTTSPDQFEKPSSSPVSNAGDLVGWCAKYKLDGNVLVGLEKLCFRIGDGLYVIMEQDYMGVGLMKLQWNHVLKASRLDRAARKGK